MISSQLNPWVLTCIVGIVVLTAVLQLGLAKFLALMASWLLFAILVIPVLVSLMVTIFVVVICGTLAIRIVFG